jgi:uncharacterized protein YceH (UPF0502 family)
MSLDLSIPLGAHEVRVLGALIEKDLTTPDYYPLTLNALTNACNQSSNRDPVVTYGEFEVVKALNQLRDRKLAFEVQGGTSRVTKFGHRMAETLSLDRPQTSVLCVLLLRGPQTVGEVRGRTGRMHDFPGLAEAEAALDALCSRPEGALAVKLRRQPGMKEQRYAHLLSGEVAQAPAGLPPEPALPTAQEGDRVAGLGREVTALRAEVAELRRELGDLRGQLGSP